MANYRSHCLLCAGGACISSGSMSVKQALYEELKKHDLLTEIRVVETGCVGSCQLGPVMIVYPDEVFYQQLTPEVVAPLVEEHFLKGRIYEPLLVVSPETQQLIRAQRDFVFFNKQVKVVLENCGLIDPENIEEYIARDGYLALGTVLTQWTPAQVVEEVKKSGLRGRGGAGFPTGAKWELMARSPGEEKYVVCNADEGDPGAFMDRSVLEGDPHRVIEAMAIAGYAVGAHKGFIYIRAEYPLAIQRVERAIQQAREYGFLGTNLFGSGFDFDVEIRVGAGAFVCGEETALLASIMGQRGQPRPRPPFPTQAGLWGKPTMINNVETYANICPIILRGGEWFASMGTEKSKGTKVFALAGRVNNTGLVEVPMGMTLREVIFDIGGGIPGGKRFKAAQTGGPSGGCIPAQHLNLPLEYDSLQQIGAIMGSGGLIVIDESSCMVDVAKFFMEFCVDESCGKCPPCRVGTKQMYGLLQKISSGQATLADLDTLEELCEMVKTSSLCGLGQTAPNPILSTMRWFREEYVAHIVDKKCPAGVCEDLVLAPCHSACPLGQDAPMYIGLIAEGKFEEALEVIRRDNPFPSVCGRICDHKCETRCRRGLVDEPIAIRTLKRFAVDYERLKGVRWQPQPIEGRKSQRVAIVGGGPAGLTAAYYLARLGYPVTVFESHHVLGGQLWLGVPEYRLPRDVLEWEIEGILSLGVGVRLGVTVGKDITLEELNRRYDAVILATGAHVSLRMGVSGEDMPGVIHGMNFLQRLNLGEAMDLTGKRVVVVGGGNVAMDVARSALRLNAAEVRVLYRRGREHMPALGEELEGAEEEGAIFQCQVVPTRILGNGHVTGVECVRMELGEFDESGRPRCTPIPGSEFVVEADLVIPAVSQEPDLSYVTEESRIALGSRRRVIQVNERTFATTAPGAFAAGDVTTGPATVVEAIAAGKNAALYTDRYLRGLGTEPLPAQPPQKRSGEHPLLAEGEQPRQPERRLPPEERRCNFREVELGFTPEAAQAEARRCLRCDLGR
jgi:NADH-quinone oxidoreductase subunit F